jgi:hypothetical protein
MRRIKGVKLETVLGEDHFEDRRLFVFDVGDNAEALFEERLQEGWELAVGDAFGRFCGDVELFGIEPTGASDGNFVDTPSDSEQASKRNVFGGEHAIAHAGVAGAVSALARFDGGDFKGRCLGG